jgi:MFS family permease
VDGILNHTAYQSPEAANHVVPFRDRLTPILILSGIFLFNFLARFIWGPLLPNIEQDLGIRHTGAGSLFLMSTIGYFIGLFVSGYRNLIIALIMPVGVLVGIGALPTMLGAFGDAGMFHAGFTLTGLFVTASTVLLWFIRLPENLKPG